MRETRCWWHRPSAAPPAWVWVPARPRAPAVPSMLFPLFASLLLASALLPSVAQAQQVPEIPAPSDTVYEIRLGDGSLIYARIVAADGDRVEFGTVGGGRLEIDRNQIRELRPARGRVVDDEFWQEDPAATRLFFTTTGRALGRGESYLGTYVIILPFAAIGVTDRISIAGGAPVLFGRLDPFYLAPKVQVSRRPNFQASLGTLSFFFDNDVFGVAYGVATFGNTDRAFTGGIGLFYAGEDVQNEPALLLAAETRISRRVKFITENYILPDAVGFLYSGGIRIIGDRFTTEIGVFGGGALDAEGGAASCCFPIINFSRPFGR